MLEPVDLGALRVEPGVHPRGQPHLSAASGLVAAGHWFHVIADDEHHLGSFAAGDAGSLRLHALLPGTPPADARERKRRKPDFEALVLLRHDVLLALGSGSTPQRERGVVLPLAPDGGLAGEPRVIELAALYAPLRAHFADLNIEGAVVADGAVRLLQRANRGAPVNACISFALAEFLAWILGAGSVPRPAGIRRFDLGTIAGVPYGFTDATPAPGGGWIFSAVAEDTADSYADGRCAGAVIGRVSAAGELQELTTLAGAPKVEGIALAGGRLLLVTDADDPARASRLLALPWPLPPAQG